MPLHINQVISCDTTPKFFAVVFAFDCGAVIAWIWRGEKGQGKTGNDLKVQQKRW